ncbi:hypothetical protein CY0110_16772 [Crocosphaera chwakensis CCY0110]|uniref:Uncharacterized protein n=1 Tax=Crocosphaera chwakensis CCY0110 TaxID=391612 RepID=A3II36_9CHRO|nr:hypothetical protein CY0110_16772 [Crocosphaera chwakensis CCY0110]
MVLLMIAKAIFLNIYAVVYCSRNGAIFVFFILWLQCIFLI